MNEEKKKRNKIIGISIGILVVLLVVISTSYAYWTITKSQDDPNSIVAACLDITMEDQFGTLTPSQNMPISDAEGLQDSGFTFTVKNHCEQDVAYIIGIDSVEVDTTGTNGYMLDGSIKVSIDNTTPRIFGSLEDIDHVEANDTYVIRNSKKINTAVVPGKKNGVEGTDTHTIKAWIDADAPVSENNKVFGGRVFITGGQFITDDNPITQVTDESCFEMNGTELIGYDEKCGTDVTIPMYVGENAVKTIDSNAFKGNTVTKVHMTEEGVQDEAINTDNVAFSLVCNNYSDYGECQQIAYAIIYDLENKDSLIEALTSEDVGLTAEQVKLSTDVLPQKENMQAEQFHASDFSIVGATGFLVANKLLITDVDLSQAYNLERIEELAFSNAVAKKQTDSSLGCTSISIDEEAEQQKGLTSLSFGKNSKVINVEPGAFAYSDFDELEIYNTLLEYSENYYCNDGTYEFYADMLPAFEGSTIDNMVVHSTKSKIYSASAQESNISLTAKININTLSFDDDFTEIGEASFAQSEIINLTLPTSLKIIGERAFNGITKATNINIPLSVTNIGRASFTNMPSTSTITMLGRTNLDGLTLGGSWNGNAEVVYP